MIKNNNAKLCDRVKEEVTLNKVIKGDLHEEVTTELNPV